VIKLFEIWPNISDLQSGYKDRRKQRVFGTGYDDPNRESIEQDYYTDESGSSSGRFVLWAACPRGGGQATFPDSRHRPQSSRVQHRCPGRAAVPCRQGVFLAGDSARIINPPTGGELGGKTPRSPGRPEPGLEAVEAVLHGQAGSARATRYIPLSHNVDGTRSDCSHYMQQQAFARFGSHMGQGAEVPHSLTMGR
jgi:hypothetical protein